MRSAMRSMRQRTRAEMATQTARRRALTIFAAYIGSVVAGLGFLTTIDDSAVAHMTMQHFGLLLPYLGIEVGAGLAFLAVLAAGIPLALYAAGRAFVRAPRDLLFFCVPLLALVVFALAGGLSGHAIWGHVLPSALNLGIGLGAAALSTAAVAVGVARGEVRRWMYRLALLPAAVAALAMGLMTLGTAWWAVAAYVADPAFFASGGGVGGMPVLPSLVAVVGVMLLTTLVAAWNVLRGIFTHETLEDLRMLAWNGKRWSFTLGGLLLKKLLGSTAEEALRERYARGEIDIETYRERLSALLHRRQPARN